MACAEGRFKSASAAGSCEPCSTGTFADGPGFDQCKTCPTASAGVLGKYQDETGRKGCKPCDGHCPAGQQHTGCAGGSAGRCVACAAGTFKGESGGHGCTSCCPTMTAFEWSASTPGSLSRPLSWA